MILSSGFQFGSMDGAYEMYDTQIQNELGFKVRKNLQSTNTDKKPLPACHH